MTNKNKVNIVAHSMGGLVAREYIGQSEGKDVNKLIMVATPNDGVWNRDYPIGLAGMICNDKHEGKECDDMHHDSPFLIRLNNYNPQSNVKLYTIAGKCSYSEWSEWWDNIVRYKSVELDNAIENYVSLCNNKERFNTENSFHNAMLNPNEAPDVYNKIVEFLKN